MKTITFYSYKGGVGRTLALVNISKRLTEFGKKVCILDFDLEAPGLHIKLEKQIGKGGVQTGIVDYINDFYLTGNIPEDISKYSTKLIYPHNKFFIAAGNPLSNNYWKKLAQINWWDLFYSEKGEGIPFFLDLKERIKQTYNPDYLLIDPRTGISELSAVTISILADIVVIFAANNKENIQGCKNIISSISKNESNLFGLKKDLHFVLCRIPIPDSNKPDEKTREEALTKKIFSEFDEFKENENLVIKSFNILHSDPSLELDEQVKIGYEFEKTISSISKEYLSLFNELTKDDFTQYEKDQFNKIRESEYIVSKALSEKDASKSLKLLDDAISLNPKNSNAYYNKGKIFLNKENYEEALVQYNKLIELEPDSLSGLFERAVVNYNLEKYEEAKGDLEEFLKYFKTFAIDNLLVHVKNKLNYPRNEIISSYNSLIEKYPNESNAFNSRSNYLRQIGEYKNALTDIYKALELNTENGLAYSTLAEIKACQNEIPEFYRNFELALKFGFDSDLILKDKEVSSIYKPYLNDEKFLKLLEKYDRFGTLDKIKELSSNNPMVC